MEGDVIVTQDIVLYDVLGEDQNGRLIGSHRSTGVGRPGFYGNVRVINGVEEQLATALDAMEAANEPA